MDDHSVFHPLQFFEFEVIAWDYDNSSVIQQTQLRRDSAYEYYYTFWSKMIVLEFVPYTTLIVLNTVIVWKIAKSR